MNKSDGLYFLKEYNLKTIDLLTLEDLKNNPSLLKEGLSLRLASKHDNIDVNLPSRHNVKDINEVLDFYQKYQNNYNILIHKTLTPELIGSISKYKIGEYTSIVIETFKDFNDRKQEIVNNRAILTMIDDRIININHESFNNKNILLELLHEIKDISYNTFDIEFVYQKELIFTDFYSKDYSKSRQLIKSCSTIL